MAEVKMHIMTRHKTFQSTTRYIGFTGFPLVEFHAVLERTQTKVDTVLSYARNIFTDSSLQVPYPPSGTKTPIPRATSRTSSPRASGSSMPLRQVALGLSLLEPGMGLLTNAGPPVWHPASSELKVKTASLTTFTITIAAELMRGS